MRKILLVEDDLSLGNTLKERLSKEFLVTWSQGQREALEALNGNKFDLLILDVGLPDGSGFQIAEQFGQMTGQMTGQMSRQTPIIFLTAQSDAESRLKGFELGAREYIPKPFHLKELLMRVQHVLQAFPVSDSLQLPECQVFFDEMKIKKNTGEIEYPALKDLRVLQLLVKKAPEAVSRDQILDEVWGPDKELNHRTVDNTIVRLKKILGDEKDQLIRSVRGVGYQWIYENK
ncbi:MAG: response regulator transcription factor [Bdellovibrionaceae bacterium]|nr:response regulator transcription factor [Pseudobdellovibrionaceae bacterium]